MAGDWIKMRMDLPEDPAVFKLAAITGLDRLSIIGRLYAFWAWADKHAVDGRVDGATSQVVDDVVRFDGFANALVTVKWLELGDDYIAMPNHDRHNGESAKERSLKNARQARWRAGKDSPVVAGASTEPSTREEKKREENKKKEQVPRKRGKQSKVPMPEGFGISDRVKAWAAEKGHDRLDEHLESFQRKCAANSYTYADWDAAFMEAIRGDWAKLGSAPPKPSPKSFGPKAAMRESETPLERALGYAKQRYERGEFGTGTEAMNAYKAECQAQTQKHRSMQ